MFTRRRFRPKFFFIVKRSFYHWGRFFKFFGKTRRGIERKPEIDGIKDGAKREFAAPRCMQYESHRDNNGSRSIMLLRVLILADRFEARALILPPFLLDRLPQKVGHHGVPRCRAWTIYASCRVGKRILEPANPSDFFLLIELLRSFLEHNSWKY